MKGSPLVARAKSPLLVLRRVVTGPCGPCVVPVAVTTTTQWTSLKNESERLDIITAYQQVGTYHSAADMCGTSHKLVARVVAAFEACGDAGLSQGRAEQVGNYGGPGDGRSKG